MTRPYRILTFDGGGVRGIVPAIVLRRLSAEPGLAGWLDGADLLAGTSTGGILAVALARGLLPRDVEALYQERGPEIFKDAWWDDLLKLGRILGPDYRASNLRRVLHETLGDVRLADLGRRVLVTAFDLDNEEPVAERRRWKPKIFHNFPGPDSDGDVPAWKAACYTSAAPTYFASVDGYVDGGVVAPNPSMCALAQTQDPRIGETPALSDVVLLSIGTGTPLRYAPGTRHAWGLGRWARPLVDVIFEGVGGIADYQCGRLLGDRYHRLAPAFPPGAGIALDDAARIPDLVAFAEGLDLGPTVGWLREAWVRG